MAAASHVVGAQSDAGPDDPRRDTEAGERLVDGADMGPVHLRQDAPVHGVTSPISADTGKGTTRKLTFEVRAARR
ncbi:hypothetical protein AB0I06_34140 [Streptomyces sp. NPDC050674]|uniref:hypothetical protein n=1 Tax=Streptomyces sp. NPDC050674 TaxID=3157216 RepID=UPI00342B6591